MTIMRYLLHDCETFGDVSRPQDTYLDWFSFPRRFSKRKKETGCFVGFGAEYVLSLGTVESVRQTLNVESLLSHE